jgi:hypothetical protein
MGLAEGGRLPYAPAPTPAPVDDKRVAGMEEQHSSGGVNDLHTEASRK